MTGHPQGSERRAHVRRKLRIAAALLLPGGKTVDARTLDISAGGMGLLVGANPPKGSVFHLEANLPMRIEGNAPLRAKVEVMQSIYGRAEGGFMVGVRFVDIQPESEAVLASFLKP